MTVPNQDKTAKARAALKAKREAGSVEILDPIEKAMRNPKSLRLAIRAKCWECVGKDDDPNPRKEVAGCTAPQCPLWPLRPWQDGSPRPKFRRDYIGKKDPRIAADADTASRAKAIKAKCFECMGGARKLVRECPSNGEGRTTRCPLWHVRPWR